jgi:hypothetical protein
MKRRRKKRPEKKPEAKRRRAPSERRERGKRPGYIRRELNEPRYAMGFHIWNKQLKNILPKFVPIETLHDLWLVQEGGSGTGANYKKKALEKLGKVSDQKVISFLFNYAINYRFPQSYGTALTKLMVEKLNKKSVERILSEMQPVEEEAIRFPQNELTVLTRRLLEGGDRHSLKPFAANLAKMFSVDLIFTPAHISPFSKRLTQLAYRVTPERDHPKLKQVEKMTEGEGLINSSIILAGFAANPKMMQRLPTDLNDKKQRRQIEYLVNFKAGLEDRSANEIIEAMGMSPKKKKKK